MKFLSTLNCNSFNFKPTTFQVLRRTGSGGDYIVNPEELPLSTDDRFSSGSSRDSGFSSAPSWESSAMTSYSTSATHSTFKNPFPDSADKVIFFCIFTGFFDGISRAVGWRSGLRHRFRRERCGDRFLGWSNRMQCRHPFATAAAFFRCCVSLTLLKT